MSEIITVARPYAKAVFEHALDKNNLAQWSAALDVLRQVVGNKQATDLIANPTLERDKKVAFLLSFLSELTEVFRAEFTNFLQLLGHYGRLNALKGIANLYEGYRTDYEKSIQVSVTSAYPISTEQETTLTDALSKRLGRQIVLTKQVDNTLIGGAIIQAKDLVIDGSVKGKLENLSAQLAG